MIFCTEDDEGVREMMLYTLRASGYEARGFGDAASFWDGMRAERPDLVMLDIMLPDEDGITVLKKLRGSAATRDIPVIMATAKGTEFDKVIGLDAGADDYLAKPFGMMEMISRIRAVMRRAGPREAAVLRCGGIELDEQSHRVFCRGTSVELTLKEYELLRLFLLQPGRAFTRDQLLASVWEGGYAGETRTVDVHIASLRTKLGDEGARIRTVRGVGYRLEAGA